MAAYSHNPLQPVNRTKLRRWMTNLQTPLLIACLLAICYMSFTIGQRSVNGGTPIHVRWLQSESK